MPVLMAAQSTLLYNSTLFCDSVALTIFLLVPTGKLVDSLHPVPYEPKEMGQISKPLEDLESTEQTFDMFMTCPCS